MKKIIVIIWGVSLAGLFSGCASHRVNQFTTMAVAGREYSRGVAALTEQAVQVAVDADSELLLKDRDLFNQAERRELYHRQTESLMELIETLQALRRHALLLERYFVTLSLLATSDTPAGLSREAAAIVDALQGLHPHLAGAVVGNLTVGDLLEEARPLAAAGWQRWAIERELKKNAVLIERELALQKSVLQALASELRADLAAVTDARAFTEVARPYIDSGRLPANWSRRRREILSMHATLDAVANAERAAEEMHLVFRALVENRLRPEDWTRLAFEIDGMLDFLALVRNNLQL